MTSQNAYTTGLSICLDKASRSLSLRRHLYLSGVNWVFPILLFISLSCRQVVRPCQHWLSCHPVYCCWHLFMSSVARNKQDIWGSLGGIVSKGIWWVLTCSRRICRIESSGEWKSSELAGPGLFGRWLLKQRDKSPSTFSYSTFVIQHSHPVRCLPYFLLPELYPEWSDSPCMLRFCTVAYLEIWKLGVRGYISGVHFQMCSNFSIKFFHIKN